MKFGIAVAAVVSLLATGVSAQENDEQDVVSLKRSSDWVLDYADDRCRLVAIFGEGEDRTPLIFEQYHPSSSLRWMIAGPYLKGMRKGREATVQFGPTLEPFTVEYDDRTFGEYGELVGGSWHTTDTAESADEQVVPISNLSNRLDASKGREVRWIGIQRSRKPMLKLETGELESLAQAMNSCIDNLVASWGLDPEQDRRRARGPKFVNQVRIFRALASSYPSSARSRGMEADRQIRVLVDAAGKVTQCAMADVTSAERFDDRACELFRREAKFEPASDTEGKPIPSYYIMTLSYRLR